MLINDNGTEREATKDEIAYYAQWAKDVQEHREAQAAAQAERSATRQAVLDKLGLTADEAAALLG
jgi:hypothetical protein